MIDEIRLGLMGASVIGGIFVMFYIQYRMGLPEYETGADFMGFSLPNPYTVQPWVVALGAICIAVFFGCILSFGNWGFQ